VRALIWTRWDSDKHKIHEKRSPHYRDKKEGELCLQGEKMSGPYNQTGKEKFNSD